MLTKESAVKRILRFLAQVTVSILFSLLGGILLLLAAWEVVMMTTNDNDPVHAALIGVVCLGGLGYILGTTVGAATGATIFQRVSRRRGSFWRALLGSAAGLLAGGCVLAAMWVLEVSMTGWCTVIAIASIPAPMAVGAVLGSWWKAKPRDAASPPV
jgi:MFS family permease